MHSSAAGSIIRPLVAAITLAVPGRIAEAQASKAPAQQVQLGAVLTAFLVDSGVRTRGLPWTTGESLPIRWSTPRPVSNPDPVMSKQGVTLRREGTVVATLGDTVALEMVVVVTGGQTGLASVTFQPRTLEVSKPGGGGFFVHREMVEQALRNQGLTFQPIKCKRETEGASYGNLVDAVKAPGKTASGLWWMWDSPRDGPTLMLTLLYRRADMNQVECFSG